MRLIRTFTLALAASLTLMFSVFASGAHAQAAAWDQKAVTAIATKLEAALRDLNITVRQNPQTQLGSSQRRAQFTARESLRLLVSTSQRLASQLRAGEDLDATLPTYRRLQMLRRDAERAARRADIQAPTVERITNAQALLDQLSPFYGTAAAEEEAAEAAAPVAPATEPAPAPAP